jgi:N-hydroxyarylamine O-acetyltransferase
MTDLIRPDVAVRADDALWPTAVEPLAPDLLERYLAFTGAEIPAEPTLDALATLQLAHLYAIPWENFDALLNRAVSLDQAAVIDKLTSGKRGGYCFEHNLLFARVLVAFGYDVDLLAGRVLLGAADPRPRTHLALRVRIDGADILSDVGFGVTGFRAPLRFELGVEQRIGDGRFRLMGADGEWLVQYAAPGSDGWEAFFALDPRPEYPVDCEMANYWVATSPKSTMKQQATLLKLTSEGKRSLSGTRLVISETDRHVDRQITLDEVDDVLRDEFGIRLPEPLPYLER